MGRGIPLPSRPEGLGDLERSFEIINTILQFDYLSFLSHDAMRARYMLWACLCLSTVSVRLSVTSWCSTKTGKLTIKLTTPLDSQGILV